MASPAVASPVPEGSDTEQNPSVQVVFGTMEGIIGRIKAPPVCVDESLKAEAMSVDQLTAMCFPLESPPIKPSACSGAAKLLPTTKVAEPSVVSSSSSTASRESALSSDFDFGSGKVPTTPVRLERNANSMINHKVTNQKTSRNGRQTQRWHTDTSTQRVARMVAGCVPILEGGQVLLVSASRKPEWILPKGGWEKDETMEEAAIRESFEEAGILGTLGPVLTEFEYETRKAKKRRLEMAELQKKAKILRESYAADKCSPTEMETKKEAVGESSYAEVTKSMPQHSTDDLSRLRGAGLHRISDETVSVASDASRSYSHVRLTMFPLYVSEVKSSWPEEGRVRKAVSLDEAIRLCESRPELLAALQEVKKRNLHILSEESTPTQLENR